MRGLAWLRQGFAVSQIPGNALLPTIEEDAPYLFVNNPLFAPITLGLEVESTHSSKSVLVIPARSRSLAFGSELADGYSYRWHYMMGDYRAHPDGSIYDLPFAPGSSFPVSQGYHSNFSHHDGLEFALDFAMPEGTPVYAAREGTVVSVEVSNTKGRPDPTLQTKANAITVLHPDGTLAHYAHLSYRGSLVSVGQQVARGDMIGFSGNTGYSSGPHLHFHVYRALSAEGSWQSLPVQFYTTNGVEQLLENTQYVCPILRRR